MKRIIIILCMLVLVGYGSTDGSIGTPIVKTTTWLNVPFEAPDTATGVGRIPDSVSVITFFGNCTNASIFQVSSASLDSNWWDSTQTGTGVAGSKIYYFKEVIADIDADSGAGLYTGVINAWFQGYPMPTYFSFYLLDGDFNDLLMTMEPATNRKNVYVKVDSSATNDGTNWDNACSIHKAIDYCTDAAEYFIYVAAGTYKDVEITDSIGHTHWIGVGADETKLWGVVEPNPTLPEKHLLRLKASWDDGAYSDTSSVEVTGFEFHGYEATSGVEDSATLYGLKINEPTSGFYIHDNVFYNFLRPIFVCSNTRHGRIEDNWLGKPIKYGMEICGGYEHRIHNNVIDSLLDGRVGIYSSAGQGQIVYSENIINAAGGRAFRFTAASKRGVVVNNFVRAVVADSAFEDLGTNIFLANHIQSQISDPQTMEEDIASRLAPTTSGRTLDVTANGEAGIDLDNASGTLDAGEIGADAITAAKIADDAIDYATFAATAPTAWWPEGKADYKLAADGLDIDTSFLRVQTHMVEDSTNIEAIKAKTDSSSYAAGGHIKSTPQTSVTVDAGSIGAIKLATAHAVYETLFVHKADFHSVGDTNMNPFQAGTDNVFLTGNYAQIANDNYDTMFVHKTDFHSTGFASPSDVRTQCADAFSDSGYTLSRAGNLDNLDEAISGLDDNPWNNAKTDTVSGMGDWFADYFNAVFGPRLDSLVQSIADANKVNFKATGFATSAQGDSATQAISDVNKANFKADVSGVSTFDNTSDAVIVGSANSSSFDSVDFKPDYWSAVASHSDSGAIGSSPWTAAGVGSVYVYLDSTADAITDPNKANFKYGGGAGSGANQVTIRVKSATDSASIPGATVALWNSDQSALMGLLGSDVDSGKAVFAADNGVYYLRIQKYKFQWDVPIRIGVSGNKDTTIYATEFTPTPPPSVDFCTVYGYIDSIGLGRDRAKISVTIHAQNLRVGTKILAYGSYTKSVYTDVHGYWEMFLPPNADITPVGTVYHFTIEIPGMETVEKYLTVPDLTTWEFTW